MSTAIITIMTIMLATMPMTDAKSFIRLQTWLSPAFPTGAFSYSHGLEAAIANARIADGEELADWLGEMLTRGPGWNDAVLLAESWRQASQGGDPAEVAELALALGFSAERQLETTAQGNAFLKAAKAWCDLEADLGNCPLPVAVGAVAAKSGIGLELTLNAYLHAYVSNQIQAALRLMKLGQQGGVELLCGMEDRIVEISGKAARSTLDDLGSATFLADIAAMQHETMQSRIFRS